MDSATLMKLAVGGAVLFAAYKFGPQWAKGMALGVAGYAIARRVPYVQDLTA